SSRDDCVPRAIAAARGSNTIVLDTLSPRVYYVRPPTRRSPQNDWPRGQFQLNQTDRVIVCHHPAPETTARRFKHGGKKCSEWERIQTKKRARLNPKPTATQLAVIHRIRAARPSRAPQPKRQRRRKPRRRVKQSRERSRTARSVVSLPAGPLLPERLHSNRCSESMAAFQAASIRRLAP